MVAILLTNLSERIAGYELCEAAHENTTPNYRKDVLQMLDMLTWPLHTGPGRSSTAGAAFALGADPVPRYQITLGGPDWCRAGEYGAGWALGRNNGELRALALAFHCVRIQMNKIWHIQGRGVIHLGEIFFLADRDTPGRVLGKTSCQVGWGSGSSIPEANSSKTRSVSLTMTEWWW